MKSYVSDHCKKACFLQFHYVCHSRDLVLVACRLPAEDRSPRSNSRQCRCMRVLGAKCKVETAQ